MSKFKLSIVVTAIVLAGCGGGGNFEGENPAPSQTVVAQQQEAISSLLAHSAQTTRATAPTTSPSILYQPPTPAAITPVAFFSWAEKTYPVLFNDASYNEATSATTKRVWRTNYMLTIDMKTFDVVGKYLVAPFPTYNLGKLQDYAAAVSPTTSKEAIFAELKAIPICSASVTPSPPSYNNELMKPVCGSIYVQPSTEPSYVVEFVKRVDASRAAIKKAYGSLVTSPNAEVLACSKDTNPANACNLWFDVNYGGYATGKGGKIANDQTAIVSSTDSLLAADYVLTHELSHVELGARTNGAWVPAWFNEGLAVYVGCFTSKNSSDNIFCKNLPKGIDDLRRLDYIWAPYVNDTGSNTATFNRAQSTYAQSRLEVETWINRRGGMAAVNALLSDVRAGKSFYSSYGSLMTQ